MYALIVTEKGGTPKRLEFDKDEVTIGRVPGNDVILPKGNVSKRHSRVVRQDGRFFVVDLKSTNGTYLNGRRITTPSPIRPGDKIYVGDFVVVLDMGDEASAAAEVMGGDEVMEAAPPMDYAGEPARDSRPPMPEPSMVEPLPLDEEPPDSSPPPPMAGRAAGQAGGPIAGPRAGMMTQPLGSVGMPGPSPKVAAPMGGVAPPPARPTQPPPRMPGARPPGASPSQALPTPAAPPSRPTLGGAVGPRPPSMAGAPQSAIPTSPSRPAMPVPAVAPPAVSPVAEAPRVETRGRPGALVSPPAGPARAAETAEVEEARGEEVTSVPSPAAVAPMLAPAPVAPPVVMPPASSSPPATLNIQPQVVDAVIQSHRAAAAEPTPTGAEPTPPGQDYAHLLDEVIAEARAAGAAAPADKMADAAARARIRSAVDAVARRRKQLPTGVTVERLVRDATAEIAGAGGIELALEEPEVTTVIVDADRRVLVGRGDAVGPSPFWFSSHAAMVAAVDRLLHASGQSRSSTDALVDATLADGARLLAVLPPAAPSGPMVVLERAPVRAPSLVDLAAREMLSSPAATLLGHAIAARRNVIVTGSRGAGRTTLLAALAATAAQSDRCVVVESRREIGAAVPGISAINAHDDWKRAIDVALRLRAQRLVIGEATEASAAAAVSLLSTGAEGMLLTAEGASPQLALTRLAALAASGGGISREDALARLASTRPLVVHVARLGDGTCRVAAIGEVRAGEGGSLQLDEAFTLRIERAHARGRIEATLAGTGVVPAFVAAQ